VPVEDVSPICQSKQDDDDDAESSNGSRAWQRTRKRFGFGFAFESGDLRGQCRAADKCDDNVKGWIAGCMDSSPPNEAPKGAAACHARLAARHLWEKRRSSGKSTSTFGPPRHSTKEQKMQPSSSNSSSNSINEPQIIK